MGVFNWRNKDWRLESQFILNNYWNTRKRRKDSKTFCSSLKQTMSLSSSFCKNDPCSSEQKARRGRWGWRGVLDSKWREDDRKILGGRKLKQVSFFCGKGGGLTSWFLFLPHLIVHNRHPSNFRSKWPEEEVGLDHPVTWNPEYPSLGPIVKKPYPLGPYIPCIAWYIRGSNLSPGE